MIFSDYPEIVTPEESREGLFHRNTVVNATRIRQTKGLSGFFVLLNRRLRRRAVYNNPTIR
jgi:hypothetical protein